MQPEDVHRLIAEALPKSAGQLPEVAYYGGSFTALPLHTQSSLLTPAYEFLQAGLVQSIRISTRPDYINQEILTNLKAFGVSTIELGAQSLDDVVLRYAVRGHTYQHVKDAVQNIKQASLQCGLQLMVGLPGETWTSLLLSARRAVNLRPDFLRLYPTIVIDSTPLADLFHTGDYSPLTLREAVSRCAYLKLLFEYHNKLSIIRTGLQASDFLEQPGTIIAGPYHPSFGEMVDSYIFYLMLVRVLDGADTKHVLIHYHPKDHSKLRGIRNDNLDRLKAAYDIKRLELVPCGLNVSHLTVFMKNKKYVINPNMIFSI